MTEQPPIPHYADITMDCSIRQLFLAAAAECTPPDGVLFQSDYLVNGVLYKGRLDVRVLALPNAGSEPTTKH